MLEFAIGFAVLFGVFLALKPAKKYRDVQMDKAEVWATKEEVELQKDLEELNTLVVKTKEKQGGKWYSIADIEANMASDKQPEDKL